MQLQLQVLPEASWRKILVFLKPKRLRMVHDKGIRSCILFFAFSFQCFVEKRVTHLLVLKVSE